MARILTFAYPGDLNTLTGGYLYDKHIIEALRHQGWTVHCLSLEGQFPHPDPQDLQRAVNRLAAVPADSELIVDGLALGAMGGLAEQFSKRTTSPSNACSDASSRGFIALVHHPLTLESGISPENAERLKASEAAALTHASHIIVTSDTTRQTVESLFKIEATRITTVEPGTERSSAQMKCAAHPATYGQHQASGLHARTILLSVGSVIARKGYDVLVQALSGLRHLDWELRIVGDAQRDAYTAQCLREQITQLNLSDRITLLGSLDACALETQYLQADIFVLASRYEGYGMAYAEAMLWGLPIVGTTGGAIAQTVSTSGSLLVEPGNFQSLQRALERLLNNKNLRQTMAHASWRDGQRLPSWQDSAHKLANTLQNLD